MKANLAEAEAKALNIAATTVSLRADLMELASLVRAADSTRDGELEDARKGREEAEGRLLALSGQVKALQGQLADEQQVWQATTNRKLNEAAQENAKLLEEWDESKRGKEGAERALAALQERVAAAQSETDQADSISRKELEGLRKTAALLGEQHTWTSGGKARSHGNKAGVLWECKCGARIIAPEDFLQW